VIDGDPDSREVLRQMVESMGGHVILAEDGEDAPREIADRHRLKLALLSISGRLWP
jgi:hypothetical protein